RVDRHQPERVDLVGRAHQAELCRDRGAGAADEQQRGQHRRQLAVEAEADQRADLVGGAVGLQRAVAEQGHRQADEGAADGDDRQRARADLVDLAHQLGEEVAGRLRRAQHREREQAGAAERAGGGDEGHQAASTRRAALSNGRLSNGMGPSGWPSRNWRISGSPLACSSAGVPENTMRPLAITSAWSATGRVSCTWWLTMMLVMPRLSLRRETRFMITPLAIGSRP